MAKMPKHSNAMPKGSTATAKGGNEGYVSGGGAFSKKFGAPGGPNGGVSPVKGTGQSLAGRTAKLGANGSRG
jgi:hypothetical protein